MNLIYGLAPDAFDVTHTNGPLTIRPLLNSDRAEWGRLWTGYLEFYKTSLPQVQYDLTFSRFLDPTEPMFGYVAVHAGKSKGLVHIILHRSGWLNGPTCYLQDLYVDPDARGTQMGRALIEHVGHVVKQAGGTKVHWLTHATNATARRLYDRVAENGGFIQYTQKI